MRTIACFFLILLLGILSVCVQPAAAQSTVDQHWIDQLKNTRKSDGSWALQRNFCRLVRGSRQTV
jgi:hypothetical protein